MSEQELDPKVVAASTRSVMMFLERTDTQLFPKELPHATIDDDVVIFDHYPELNNGSKLPDRSDIDPEECPELYPTKEAWRMERHAENLIDGFTWFSIGTFRGDGTQVGKWTSPICIKIGRDGANGADGKPGEDGYNGTDGADGADIEYIFKLVDDEEQFNALAKPVSDPEKDDYIPTGWNDHPTGISSEHRIEAMCYREKRPNRTTWSDFNGPYIWSNWGEKGRDGDGVEYIFRLATLPTDEKPEAEAYYDEGTGIYHLKEQYWPPTTQEEVDEIGDDYQEKEYLPVLPGDDRNWQDDPQDVYDEKPVQFVSVRKYDGDTGKWRPFSEPKCWNKIPLIDSVVTSFTAFSFTITEHDISDYKPKHADSSALDTDPDDFYYDKTTGQCVDTQPSGDYDVITWSDSIPNEGVGFVWMTTAVFVEGELSEKGWCKPMKINDSPGFQAEYSKDYPWDDENPPKLPNFGDYNENENDWREAAADPDHFCGHWYDIWADNPNPDESVKDPTYMACCRKQDGKWTDWVVVKIKGENGLSPVYLHIGNDHIGVAVDDNHITTAATMDTISAEIQIGGNELEIDPNNVSFTTVSGGALPSDIIFSNGRVDTEGEYAGKRYHAEITIPAGLDLTNTFKIRMRVTGEGYDAYNFIYIVGVPGGNDGVVPKIVIDGNYLDIDRFNPEGDCSYVPSTLVAYGIRTVGLNDPELYGDLKYSVSTEDDDFIFQIKDIYTAREDVFDFPSDGLVIKNIPDHKTINRIFLYLVNENNMIVDVAELEIDNEGEFVVSPSVTQIWINDGALEPATITVTTKYRKDNTDAGVLITDGILKYYWNGDTENKNTCTYRNTPFSISSLTGWNISTAESLTFVLTSSSGGELTVPVTILISNKPKNGNNGTSVKNMNMLYKAYPKNSSVTSPSAIIYPTLYDLAQEGWTTSAPTIDDRNPELWCFLRIEYDNDPPTVKHMPAYLAREYNPAVDVDYTDVKDHIKRGIDENLADTSSELYKIDKTYTDITTDGGLTSLINTYTEEGQKSFANIIADAAKAKISSNIGVAIWGEDTTKTLTSVGSELNGLDGKITQHATALFGEDGEHGLTADINDVRSEMDAMEGTLTNTVAKATYTLIRRSDGEPCEYAAKTGDTAIGEEESLDTYNHRMDVAGYDVVATVQEMSMIQQKSNKISLIVGDDNQYLAALQVLGKAELGQWNPETKRWTTVDPNPDGTAPTGSVIRLDADQVHINGDLIIDGMYGNEATISNILSDYIHTNTLITSVEQESGSSVNTKITGGCMEIYKGAITDTASPRVRFGVDSNGDIVLQFLNSAGTVMYDLGPAGFTDPSGNPVYDNTW